MARTAKTHVNDVFIIINYLKKFNEFKEIYEKIKSNRSNKKEHLRGLDDAIRDFYQWSLDKPMAFKKIDYENIEAFLKIFDKIDDNPRITRLLFNRAFFFFIRLVENKKKWFKLVYQKHPSIISLQD